MNYKKVILFNTKRFYGDLIRGSEESASVWRISIQHDNTFDAFLPLYMAVAIQVSNAFRLFGQLKFDIIHG